MVKRYNFPFFLFLLLIFSIPLQSQIHYYTNLQMSGSKENPATGSTAKGVFNGWYDESSNMLGFTATFQGLSGPTSAAHFHGPAHPDSNAGVQIGWTGFPTGLTSGSFSDTVTLTAAQETQLLAGRWYTNIHTSVYPGGEIRTQLFETSPLHSFTSLPMLGSKEVPPNISTATGTFNGVYNESTNEFIFTATFSGLAGTTTAAHFHGPAPVDSNAGVQIGWSGFPTGVMSGVFSDTVVLSEAQEDQLLAGRWYTNIHSSVYPGGEIRTHLFESPGIDGNLSDPAYTEIASKQNTNSGFGTSIDVNRIFYYANAYTSTLHLAFEGKLNTGSSDGIGFWLGFNQLTGVPAGTPLGGTPGGHYMGGNGGANPNFRADFEVDYMFAVNPGGGTTNIYLDAVKLVGGRTSQYLGTTNQTGTPTGNLNSGFFPANTVWFAFNNNSALNKGFEISIPFSQLGVTSAGTVNVFAFIASSTAFFSDVTTPGNVSGGNPGFDVNFSTLPGGPYNTSSVPLPVELASFSASVSGNSVELNWITVSELNNAGFEVQRSTDNVSFNKIGFIEGKGTTAEIQTYKYTDGDVSNGKYFYRLKQIDFDGTFEFSDAINVLVGTPSSFELSQNYPNPFNPTTSIKFQIPQSSIVSLKIYNILGKEVAVLVNEFKEAGNYQINFDAGTKGLTSGVYFYKLNAGNLSSTKKLILLK
jgi:hypothetical protein